MISNEAGWRTRESSSPDIAEILQYWSDLTFIDIVHVSRSQLCSGALQRSEHFSSIFSKSRNIKIPFEIWWSNRLFQSRMFFESMDTHQNQNQGQVQDCNVTFDLAVLNVTTLSLLHLSEIFKSHLPGTGHPNIRRCTHGVI